MTNNDLLGLAASYAYALGLIGVAELLRRNFGMLQEHTRKLVHIGAGMWVFGTLALFDNWQWGVLPFATFIGANYLFYRYRVFGAVDARDSTPGTVYFALAITLLFGLLWRPLGPVDHAPVAVAATMALTWGDAMAALVGRRYGWRRYRVGRGTRSWEGSAAMLIVSALSIGLVLTRLPGSALSPLSSAPSTPWILLATVLSALVATLVEAISPQGSDNLNVPLAAAAVLYLMVG